MESIFESKLSFHSSLYPEVKAKLASIKHTGDDDFMEWMSAFDSTLRSKFPSLSKEAQSKLQGLFILNQQADTAVDEVVQNINRCEQEFEALNQKISDNLEQLEIGDDDVLSFDTIKLLQESVRILMDNQVGDGTELSSVVNLAKDFLNASNLSRQKLGLTQDINVIQGKNNKLRENLKFFERESKLASEEVANLHSKLRDASIDLDLSQKKAIKLNKTVSLSRNELDEHSVSPANSDQSILDSHNNLKSLLNEIVSLEEKLKHYDKLPSNIPEAVQIVKTTKEHLNVVTNNLKVKLTARYVH